MKTLRSVYNLLERVDYFAATLAVTLLGGIAGGEGYELRLGIAILSNLLLYSFAVVYQKIETAPSVAFERKELQQNPIASGEISLNFANTLSGIMVLLCLALASLLGTLNINLSFVGIFLAIALSHHNLKLGNSALMHLGKHQSLLSVIFGLSGFLATAQKLNSEAILLAIFLLTLGFLFTAWTTEKTTRPLSRPLLIILVVFASGAAYVLFVIFEIIPHWALSLIVLLSVIIAFIKHRFNPHQHSMPKIVYDSLVIATTFSLIISYLVQVFL